MNRKTCINLFIVYFDPSTIVNLTLKFVYDYMNQHGVEFSTSIRNIGLGFSMFFLFPLLNPLVPNHREIFDFQTLPPPPKKKHD